MKEKRRENMKIQPFGERVALKIVQEEETTESGLVMSTSKSKTNRGVIVAVGDEVHNLEVGESIIFTIGSGTNYTDGSDEYKVINVRDVIGKIIKE